MGGRSWSERATKGDDGVRVVEIVCRCDFYEGGDSSWPGGGREEGAEGKSGKRGGLGLP